MVQDPPQAVIVISGAANLTRLVYEFELGLRIFHDVHIFSTSQPSDSSSEEESYDDDVDANNGTGNGIKATKLDQKVAQSKAEREYF